MDTESSTRAGCMSLGDFPEVVGPINAQPKDHTSRADSTDRIAAAGRVYGLLGHPERLRVEHPDCGHDFQPEMRGRAYAWLDAALRGGEG
jgi:hypothetical protein